MVLSKYISGTIFIDDKKEDVEKLIQYFEIYNIWSKFINPDNFDGKSDYNYAGARLVFLDLQYSLSGTAELKRAVSILRELSDSGVKNFILVVWSMHNDEIDELTNLINEKMKENKPLLILDADKEKCLNINIEEFNAKIEEMFEKSIKENPLIYYMLEWEKNTVFASRDTFNDIVSLSYDDQTKSFDLNKVLIEMSKAAANDSELKSSFRYMHDILSDNIIKYGNNIEDMMLDDPKQSDDILKLKLNALQMIKKGNITKENPGDIYTYELDDENKQKFISELLSQKNIEIPNSDITPILLNITPPCTFLKSNNLIMVEGIIISDYSDELPKMLSSPKKNYSINFYFDETSKKVLILDFIRIRYIEKENINLSKLFCLKTEFRSSIQQEFGSFLTRIGNNIIPIKK